jgi:hypothetical protein
VGLVYAVVFRHLVQPPAPAPTADQAEATRERIAAGQKALAAGNFQLAAEQFRAAQEGSAKHPEALTPAERRQLGQLRRQADLLAELLPQSLEEILTLAVELPDAEEWQAQFARLYKGRSVVFDDQVRQDEMGRYHLRDYARLRVDGRTVRVELGKLDLPMLDQPQRLVFGVRLASVGLEPGGVWVVRFEPDSAVLLTDPGALAACCPALTDEAVKEITDRQLRWSER